MKISVITPSYNQGKYIRRTIESVLTQDVDELEYIVMDGGSTDETVDILKNSESKIIWKSEKDDGQADAVNKGIKMATGDIIGWINSDDIYYPGAIKKVLNVFEKNPEINVVYGDANHIREDDSFIERYYTEPFDYNRLKDICFICQPALFFRKEIVKKYGFLDPSLQYCMDYDYWLRVGKKEKFYYTNELLAGSRLYDENKTIGSKRKVHEEILQMQEKNLGKASEKWVYNLAHVIVDEMGIPRQIDGKNNVLYAHKLAKVTMYEFLKHYHYIPVDALKNIKSWMFVS